MENQPRTVKSCVSPHTGTGARRPGLSQVARASFSLYCLWGKKDAGNHKTSGATLRTKWPLVSIHLPGALVHLGGEGKKHTFSHCLNLRLKYSTRRQFEILLRKSEFLIIL